MLSWNGERISIEAVKEMVKPTLNALTISLNASGGLLNVSDYRNGNFTETYRLYLNGEDTGKTFAEKSILITDYGIGETDEIAITAGAELFNTSPLSNTTKYSDLSDGTIGLTYANTTYQGFACTSIEGATETNIKVASIVDGKVVVGINAALKSGITIEFPDSLTAASFSAKESNITVIFGANTSSVGYAYSFQGGKNLFFDFRRATKVPSLTNLASFSSGVVVVPDNLYDEWITATNWSGAASKIIRATDYEAQQGGSV